MTPLDFIIYIDTIGAVVT